MSAVEREFVIYELALQKACEELLFGDKSDSVETNRLMNRFIDEAIKEINEEERKKYGYA